MASQSEASSNTLLTIVDAFTLAPIRDTFLDTHDLPGAQRAIAFGGYLLFFGLVLCTLGLELFGMRWSGPVYTAEAISRQISWGAVVAASMGFVLGWAYLLVGAAQARWYLVVPVLSLLALQCLLGVSYDSSFVSSVFVLVVIGAVAITLGISHRQRWFDHAPHWVLLGLTLILAVGVGAFWLSRSAAARGADAYAVVAFAFWFTEPMWVLGGLALVKFGIFVASSTVGRLRVGFSAQAVRWFGALVLLLHPPLAALIAFPLLFLGGEGTLLAYAGALGSFIWYDGLLCGGLALLALGAVVLKRWRADTAALFLALRLTLFGYGLTFTILMMSGFDMSNPFFGTVERLALFPPAFYFMGTLVLGVLGFFMPFANDGSRFLPRTSRIALIFGCAILTTTVIFFFFQSRDVETGAEISSALILPTTFYLGTTLLGLPYLIYVAFRDPSRLRGSDPQPSPAPELPLPADAAAPFPEAPVPLRGQGDEGMNAAILTPAELVRPLADEPPPTMLERNSPSQVSWLNRWGIPALVLLLPLVTCTCGGAVIALRVTSIAP